MKLNKLFLTVGLMGAVLTSCEKELHKDAELDINVQTNENITFDGKTITVKAGTPITFQLGGENDFLSFYSGEAGKKYEYRDRTEVDPNDIETSKLTMKIRTDYGNTQALDFRIMVSETFEGLSKNNFEADSIQAKKHEGWTVLKTREHINNPDKSGPKLPNPTPIEIDMKPYMGKRIALAIMYKYTNDEGKEVVTATQTKLTFQEMMIVNTMKDGSETSLTANSFGFTPLNMMHKHNLSDQKGMTANRPYGTVTNNTSGIWNMKDMNAFFIHSSGGGSVAKYSWLISNLLTVNACTPDVAEGIKNISQGVNSYKYTYNTPGTYTATFVATNAKYTGINQVVRQYTIKVNE